MIKSSVLRDLRADDSYLFLMKELEKVDEKILEPLTSTDWPRDMPVITGGGLTESIASVDISYASTGLEDDNIFYDAANDIPVIQADLSKQVARTFSFAEYMVFNRTEREKMLQVGRDPETFLDKGIKLHFDKVLDRSVYVGFPKVSSTGLCNNANIIRSSASMNAGNTSTRWKDKTADEILMDINAAISAVWEENDCSSDALPNHLLVPTEQYGQLVSRKVSDDSERSILTYVLENNLAKCQGKELNIYPLKWCSGAGSGYTDRMVVYINHDSRICFNLTQPLRRFEEEYSDMRIKIPYYGQFSEVRFLYPTTVRYLDGI